MKLTRWLPSTGILVAICSLYTQKVQTPLLLKQKTFSGFSIAFNEIYIGNGENASKKTRHYYYPIFPWIWDKLSWKKSALVRSKILGLFVNTLTAEYTYSCRNMQTFTQQVQMPLSLKQKTFSGFFIAFLKSTWNGEHFQKKGESSSLSISEIIDSKRGGYLSAWKALLQNSFR